MITYIFLVQGIKTPLNPFDHLASTRARTVISQDFQVQIWSARKGIRQLKAGEAFSPKIVKNQKGV